MSSTNGQLGRYLGALRNAETVSFEHSKNIVDAAVLLRDRNIAVLSMRVGLSVLFKRYSDALLLPLLSAGLSICILILSGQTLAIDKIHFQRMSSSEMQSVVTRLGEQSIAYSKVVAAQPTVVNATNAVAALDAVPDCIIPDEPVNVRIRQLSVVKSWDLPRSKGNQSFIDVGVRTIGSSLISNGTQSQPSKSLLQNAAFSLSYRLDDRQSIGIEIGQEFLVREVGFSTRTIVGDPVTGRASVVNSIHRASDNSLVTWYGAHYRYTISDWALAESIVPFGQVFGGYCSAGPLVKSILGLRYSPLSSVDVSAGAEFTYLNYAFEGNRQASYKAAITVGITGKW
jgi:hypothetical protein